MMTSADEDFEFDEFEADGAAVTDAEQLVVNIGGFEGPLDVLLTLARNQKVDLAQISILELVEQYLVFIGELRRLRLELAADYLVMAAWLAYLKSRLLLPEQSDDDEPSGEELALRLQLQLQRLGAMREAGARLMSRDRLGRDVFARGMPEPVQVTRTPAYDATIYELLKAYAQQSLRSRAEPLRLDQRNVYSLDDALQNLEKLIGKAINWTQLAEFMPRGLAKGIDSRSIIASTFAASLELAREGRADIRQLETYGPIYIRRRVEAPE